MTADTTAPSRSGVQKPLSAAPASTASTRMGASCVGGSQACRQAAGASSGHFCNIHAMQATMCITAYALIPCGSGIAFLKCRHRDTQAYASCSSEPKQHQKRIHQSESCKQRQAAAAGITSSQVPCGPTCSWFDSDACVPPAVLPL